MPTSPRRLHRRRGLARSTIPFHEPTFTRIVCETETGDLTMNLDAAERLIGLTIGTLALTVTYNPDGSVAIKILSDGETVLDENYTNFATLQGLGRPSAFKAIDTYRLSTIKNECYDPTVILVEAHQADCKKRYENVNTVFDDYGILLFKAAISIAETAWEDYLKQHLPDVTGTFEGIYTTSVWGCQDGTSLSLSGSMVWSIDSQSGAAFSGTFTGVLPYEEFSIVEESTLSGTVDSQGNVKGTTTHTALGTSGAGTFSGTLTDHTLVISNPGHDTAGDTCAYERTITVTR